MQLAQAGKHRVVLLELDTDFLTNIVRQAGFEFRVEDTKRAVFLELNAPDRDGPLLLFDASDPGNLGWFSRCAFYVDGGTGCVLQTPILVANMKDRGGRISPSGIRVQINKEIPYGFKMPGKTSVNEQVIYAVFNKFLYALVNDGVGVCGRLLVKPLAGRTENVGAK